MTSFSKCAWPPSTGLADSEALPEKHHKALKKTLKTINQLNEAYAAEYAQVIDTVFEHLEQHHIRVLNETQLNDEQKQFLRRFFYDKLNGSTNPIWLSAIDDLNVFEDNRIYLVVRKTHIEGDGKVKYAIIKVPNRIYGRFIKIPPSDGFDQYHVSRRRDTLLPALDLHRHKTLSL